MNKEIITIIATFAIAIAPFSLMVFSYFPKILSKYNPKLAKITTVCTAITGTLTKNALSVKSLVFGDLTGDFEEGNLLIHLKNRKTREETRVEKKQLPKELAISLMATVTTLCHYLKMHKIEAVTANFFRECGISSSQIKADHEIITTIPSSKDKKISTVVAIKIDSQEIFSYTKGNPYKILERSERMLVDGKKIEITPGLRNKLKKKISKLNKKGEKVIAFAYKPLPLKRLDHYSENFVEKDLVLIGIIGIADAINPEVIPHIQELKEMGIKIYITAGSPERKCVSIGEDLGVINPHHFEAISGKDLEEINDQRLKKILSQKEKDYIFCELKDSDRNRIIHALKSDGEVVALAKMGENLSIHHILTGIKRGRENRANFDKVKSHSLIFKIATLIILMSSVFLSVPLGINLMQILALELLINLPLEIGLNREKIYPEETKNKNNHSISIGIIIGIILSLIYVWSLIRFGWYPGEVIATNSNAVFISSGLVFTTLAIIQFINIESLRHQKKSIFQIGIFKNPYLTLLTIITILAIYILLTFETLGNYFKFKSPGVADWQIIIFVALIVLAFEEIRKKLSNDNPHSQE